MLKSLNIQSFKCFDRVEIELQKITLLAGTNSSGKSSAIQALLLLCNNAVNYASSPLNGMWLRLGTFDECRNHRINARQFRVGVSSGNENFTLEFKASDNEMDIIIQYLEISESLQNHLNFENRHIYYLPANRIGPQDSYNKNFDRINFFGDMAEFVVDFLFKNRKEIIADALIVDSASKTLEYQVNYWLTKLFGIQNTIKDLGLSNSLSIGFSFPTDSKYIRPYHMGSGVSYALGVIVSVLSAKTNDIVIIENPEIHLHPKAQSELTQFLCFASNAGIQIILETHSDHVFNGIRKSIVNKKIIHTDVAVHFFQLDEKAIAVNTVISLNEHGRVINPSKGLFDQFDDDLDQILGL